VHQLPGQRAGPATDIQDPIIVPKAKQRNEFSRQWLREAAHEAGVGVGTDIETHSAKLALNPRVGNWSRS